TSSVMYWLTHWRGGSTGGAGQECPLLAEIGAVGKLNEQSVILIDDARYFLGPPPAPHRPQDWPRLLDLIEALKLISTRHELWVINDVVIYAPRNIADDVVAYGRNHGVDLVNLAALARNNVSKDSSPEAIHGNDGRRHGLESGLNRTLLAGERSERIFALHAQRLGINRLLDIGANNGQFAMKMRRFGFEGMIYSVEPQAGAHTALMRNAHADVRWIPLARQAVGRARGRLTLNLAANTWSSSFFPTHENHLRAAPDTRTVGHESVFVTSTATLLREPLMKEIDALKIDVQGYELEVIEGFRSSMHGIQLVLLEMSLVECYVGAPDLFTLDRVLVNELGFNRVAIEPSFYDDRVGVVQQFDGIYVRKSPPLQRPSAIAAGFSAIVTSMHGKPSRVTPSGAEIGEGWLRHCVQTWQQQSNRIISVSEVSPNDMRVQWVPSADRPAIADLLAAIPHDNDRPTILCNADIAIGDLLTQLRQQLDPRTLYLANRFEVQVSTTNPQAIEVQSVYQLGFDLFVLPAEFVRFAHKSLPIGPEFRIGEPWWDYLLPLVALSAGFPVKRLPLNQPVALHYVHATKYHRDTWLSRGADFFAAIASLTRSAASRDIQLLHDLLALEGSTEKVLNMASSLVCSHTG
ncbi:MAG TPA: FkbM family methyltransferase, partial [Steroidobacteraceae bacterium]